MKNSKKQLEINKSEKKVAFLENEKNTVQNLDAKPA